ncbi:chitin synthesis regulation, resistance to congo red domain-containing protein [Sarocladium implicatum]|nr:chitin synthesis regulation, resistance to congo red domain-containing protein [Sarocladium implicatum]
MESHQFVRRASCYYNRYGQRVCNRWSSWGRWVVAGAAIFFFLLLALSCLCVARRRRKRGHQPFYGTGWMAPQGGKFGHQQPAAGYNNGYNNGYNQGGHQMYNYNQGAPQQGAYNQPYASPPAYGGPQGNDGYYGGQQYGVQTPPATYQQHNSYAPPPGPPPGK